MSPLVREKPPFISPFGPIVRFPLRYRGDEQPCRHGGTLEHATLAEESDMGCRYRRLLADSDAGCLERRVLAASANEGTGAGRGATACDGNTQRAPARHESPRVSGIEHGHGGSVSRVQRDLWARLR